MAEHTFNGVEGCAALIADWAITGANDTERIASCGATCYNGDQANTVDKVSSLISLYGNIYSDVPSWMCISRRGVLYFDTTEISADAVVTSVKLKLYVTIANNTPTIYVLDGMPNYPVELGGSPDPWEGDYDRSLYSQVASQEVTGYAYNEITLPTSCFNPGGHTKFLLRGLECQGNPAYYSYATIHNYNNTYPPQLVVDYYVPIQAEAVMASSSSMTATGAALIAAQASLSSSASFSAIPWGVIEAEVSMEAVASMLIRADVNLADVLNWYGTLEPGDVLVIDCKGRTAVLNGANAMKDISGEWVYLDPGDNDIDYTDTAGSRTVEMLVAHRPRWA